MENIDIKELLQQLEHKVINIKAFIRSKYDENKEHKPIQSFNLFHSDYNDISLDKESVIKLFDTVEEAITDIRHDVEDCGIHLEDFKKATSDFYKYCQENKKEIEEKTVRFGLYQKALTEQLKHNVNYKMLSKFNDTFTETKDSLYFHNFIRQKGGNISKKTLLDTIYCEVTNLPKTNIGDGFDEKGHLLGINLIPYDTRQVIRYGIQCDTENKPLFTFQYKRNNEGFFEYLRVEIDDQWFILYETE